MRKQDQHIDPLLREIHAHYGRRLLRLCEAAEFLAVGQSTIREWANSGDLPVLRLSDRAWRFRGQDLVDFIRSRDEVHSGVLALPNGEVHSVSPLRGASGSMPTKPKARRAAATA